MEASASVPLVSQHLSDGMIHPQGGKPARTQGVSERGPLPSAPPSSYLFTRIFLCEAFQSSRSCTTYGPWKRHESFDQDDLRRL
jgi:hypothetical protein